MFDYNRHWPSACACLTALWPTRRFTGSPFYTNIQWNVSFSTPPASSLLSITMDMYGTCSLTVKVNLFWYTLLIVETISAHFLSVEYVFPVWRPFFLWRSRSVGNFVKGSSFFCYKISCIIFMTTSFLCSSSCLLLVFAKLWKWICRPLPFVLPNRNLELSFVGSFHGVFFFNGFSFKYFATFHKL